MIIKPSSLGDYFNSLLFGGWDEREHKKEKKYEVTSKGGTRTRKKGKRSEKMKSISFA